MKDLEKKFQKLFSPRLQRKYAPPSLTPEQRKAQIKSILEKKERPPLPKKTRKSKWTVLAHKYFGESPSIEEISKKTGIPKKALNEIVERGKGAYYSAGSRPGQSPQSWGIARMYAVLFGSKGARKVDGDIVKKYDIPVLTTGSGSIKDLTRKKEYPENYDPEAVKLLRDMSFSKGKNVEILGSMALRSMLYASDYDAMETVSRNNPEQYVREFQSIIRRLLQRPNTYIGDIKAGIVKEWKIIDEDAVILKGKVYHYNAQESKEKLKKLYREGVVNEKEYKEGMRLLVHTPNTEQLREIIKKLRFHVLRWKPQDILNGYVERHGKRYTFLNAIQDPAMFKLDTVALLENGIFEEFSIVYDLRIKGKRMNVFPIKIQQSLIQDLVFYSGAKKWFKVCKRMFSLANYLLKHSKKDPELYKEVLEKVFEILNSDIGIVYNVQQDIEILLYLKEQNENVSGERLKLEIEGFIQRLSNVYSLNSYLKKEPAILKTIYQVITGKRDATEEMLRKMSDTLGEIVSHETYLKIKDQPLLVDFLKVFGIL